jgi:hypothetical protein
LPASIVADATPAESRTRPPFFYSEFDTWVTESSIVLLNIFWDAKLIGGINLTVHANSSLEGLTPLPLVIQGQLEHNLLLMK